MQSKTCLEIIRNLFSQRQKKINTLLSLGHKASQVTLSLIIPASHSQKQALQWQGWSHILSVNEDVLKLAQLFTWFETSVRRPWLQGYRQRNRQMMPEGGLSSLSLSLTRSLPYPTAFVWGPSACKASLLPLCYTTVLWTPPRHSDSSVGSECFSFHKMGF